MAAAKAKVSAAQDAVAAAQARYQTAVVDKATADQAVANAKDSLDNAVANKAQKEALLAEAKLSLQTAQNKYDTLLISDPSWVRPNIAQTILVDVPYTVQVAHTSTITETTLVPREVTTVVAGGLVARAYNMQGYNNAPPMPTANRLVSTQTVPNVNFQWGGGQVLNSGLSEDVIVSFTGNLYAPETGTYTFYSPADDGTKLYIDGNLIINDWYDKGGGGTMVPTYLTSGVHSITLWYYENGGGANVWLYWITPGGPFVIIPASAFGEQTITSIVYDQVTTTREVITYTEETQYRREEQVIMVPDENATAPETNNPDLLQPIEDATNAVQIAEQNLAIASDILASRQASYSASVAIQTEKASIIEAASKDVSIKQQELNVAQQELEAIPPFRDPTPTPTPSQSVTKEPTQSVVDKTPTPEPSTTPEIQPEPQLRVEEAVTEISSLTEVAPENLTEEQVTQLVEAALVVFDTAEQGSPEYNQALEALAVAAQADDPQVPAELAAIPLLGNVAVAALEVFNNLGNVGADMAPKTREEAKKTVIASVIAAGAAVNAVSAAAASASSSGGGTSRRNK